MRTIIVTGGSSGLGEACVQHFCDLGYRVGFTYHTRERRAMELVEDLRAQGATVAAVEVDFGEAGAPGAAIRQLGEALGGEVYGLVNNAGVNHRALLEDESSGAFDAVIGVNLRGPLFATQAAIALMPPSGGRIVNITSVLAAEPLDGAATYCASKAGLSMLTRALAVELAPRGITVNEVAPGHCATAMNFGDQQVDPYSTRRSAIPVGRPGDPREIAAAVAYFLSDDAAYATGATLLVDGGLALRSGPLALERSSEFLENAAIVAKRHAARAPR